MGPSCPHPTLCDPMDCSPPGSSVHGDSPGTRSGGEKGLRGSGAGTLGVPLGGTRRKTSPCIDCGAAPAAAWRLVSGGKTDPCGTPFSTHRKAGPWKQSLPSAWNAPGQHSPLCVTSKRTSQAETRMLQFSSGLPSSLVVNRIHFLMCVALRCSHFSLVSLELLLAPRASL